MLFCFVLFSSSKETGRPDGLFFFLFFFFRLLIISDCKYKDKGNDNDRIVCLKDSAVRNGIGLKNIGEFCYGQ